MCFSSSRSCQHHLKHHLLRLQHVFSEVHYTSQTWSSVTRLIQKLLIHTESHKQTWQRSSINACLLPDERLLTSAPGSLSVLSITTPLLSSSFLPTVHLHFLSHINCLTRTCLLSCSGNVQILLLSSAMNGRGTLYCFCFSPTHLNTSFSNSLSSSLGMVWWDSSAVWAECLSWIWPQRCCCCSADLCVWLSQPGAANLT